MANAFPSRLVDSVNGQIGHVWVTTTGAGDVLVKTLIIEENILTTNDEAGVLEYLNTQELIIEEGQVVLVITKKLSTYVEGGYVINGYVF